jgi:hypothetical protein
VPWTETELQQLEAVGVQAYKWAWGLPWTTVSDVFTLPSGMEYPRPLGIMAQELCRHLQRCLKHEDATRQLTLRDLNLACEQWAWGSLRELKDEMEVWKWDLTISNRWARLAKCMHSFDIPVECVGDTNETEERRGTSWASATRELRRLRHCIEAVGGSKDQWETGVWHMEKEQWHLLWTGEQAFWRAVPQLIAAGHVTVEGLMEPRRSSTGQPYKIQRLMAVHDGECTQTMRILLSRGIAGIDERTRGLTQRWLDMVDWRAANTRDAPLSISRSLDPARAWVERQERAPTANMSLPASTAHECANHLAQLATELRQEVVATAMDSNWRIADPSKYPQQVCQGLARLLSRGEVRDESARLLAKHIGDRLPPGGAGANVLCQHRRHTAGKRSVRKTSEV